MADFLTTLATRTLGLTPVMQPMIASIFTAGEVGEIYPASTSEVLPSVFGEFQQQESNHESFSLEYTPSLEILRTDEISISPKQLENHVLQSLDEQLLVSNQPTSESEMKSTLVNYEKTAPIRVQPVINQLNSIPEIDEISSVFPPDSPERLQNTQAKISVNPVTASSVNKISEIESTQVFTGNQPTAKSEVKSTLVNSDKITPIGVEGVVNQLNSIPEIDEIPPVFLIDSPERPQNTTAEISVNPVTPPSINQISEIDSIQLQATSESEMKPRLVNSEKIAPIRVESLNNKDKNRVNNYIQNNLMMEANTSVSLDSILTEPEKSPELITDSRISQNIDIPDIVIPQNTLESASLSQKTASKIKPIVMTHPSSVYPQWELESRQSERGNQPEPVPATPTPTIQVSIGRVEVRVSNQSTSPKTSHKSTRKEPGLSLQDYLKQRQGEKS
ncbi:MULTISPECIES: hypothetical protein [unclassified Nodularia (in: cyanobacteria)]|uniref:hypothetical protein n=1 Tax=unclassified Nodularia (in: cyanobacteria) TaxID=2656917 RepID=UPI00187FE85C|nr:MULTISPECIES: hypothetical protein [unclassified Nodularia (in: cyanobacteria)]MBE9199615.1 hypothetical protein [Nodularia sp. LEGE 06071]MCC2694944.1 hypothetical protein [Nodularia sp. LEGE 04288]